MALDATILILTDGKMGDLVQCRGVADTLTNGEVDEAVVKTKGFWALPLPFMPVSPSERRLSMFSAPHPDIVIASGRRTIPHMKAFSAMEGGPFTVFLKDPRHSHGKFDFIWAPEHDGLEGANIFSTLTAPHNRTPEKLVEAADREQARYGEIDPPILGVILGGNSGSAVWDDRSLEDFEMFLRQMPPELALLVAASRRTPKNMADIAQAMMKGRRGFFWNGEGENPYLKILARSTAIVVTGDSHNMVSEALASGAPVHVFRPGKLHRKFAWFLDELERQGLIHDPANGLRLERREPVDATPDIAAEIERRYLLKTS